MNRRDFLGTMAMLSCARMFSMPAGTAVFNKPRLKIGIISDTHIIDEDVDHGYCGGTQTFEKALTWFRDQGADGILIAGDLTDWGLQDQLRNVARAWYKVFPKDKGLGGRKVEKLFVYGNHDIDGWKWGYPQTYNKPKEMFSDEKCIDLHRAEIWEECFHEKFTPFWVKNVKGYIFIGSHYQHGEHLDGFKEYMDSIRSLLPSGNMPFFYTQHLHLKNTCSGEWAWGQDDGQVTDYLSQFPNAVAFSGHSHTVLTDERTIWQGAFTSVGTASLRYEYLFGGHENSYSDSGNDKGHAMPRIELTDGRAGLLMTVYDDCIALAKRDFVYDDYLGDDWVFPLGDNDKYSFTGRTASEKAPQFPQGSQITLLREKRKDRTGRDMDAVVLRFPNVLKCNTGIRAFDYEVTASTVGEFGMDKRVVMQRRVYSAGCYKAESQDLGDVEMVFDWDELTDTVDTKRLPPDFLFEVRPCGAFNAKGEPLTLKVRF